MEIELSTAVAARRPFPAGETSTRLGTIRLLFIDNLRWVMIMLVLSMHAAVTCSSVGSWYYNEPVKPGRPALLPFITHQTFLQSFFPGPDLHYRDLQRKRRDTSENPIVKKDTVT